MYMYTHGYSLASLSLLVSLALSLIKEIELSFLY